MDTYDGSKAEREYLPYDGSLRMRGTVFSAREAARLYDRLIAEVRWSRDVVRLFGKRIVTQREVAWFGDESFEYRYSNESRVAMVWTPLLSALKDKVESVCGSRFNSVLLNFYHDGSEGMGWHSDDEKELGDEPLIASLSFGATRRFDMRHKKTGETVKVFLESGSLWVMSGASQERWKHQAPKQLKIKEGRVNLTFRQFELGGG
ncbi:MAG: alpha-ketoglutarate-dependent dioxygenase AlkB [Verrucomicrobiota bacterium]